MNNDSRKVLASLPGFFLVADIAALKCKRFSSIYRRGTRNRRELQENSDTFRKKLLNGNNLHDDPLKMPKKRDESRKKLDMSQQFEYNIT